MSPLSSATILYTTLLLRALAAPIATPPDHSAEPWASNSGATSAQTVDYMQFDPHTSVGSIEEADLRRREADVLPEVTVRAPDGDNGEDNGQQNDGQQDSGNAVSADPGREESFAVYWEPPRSICMVM